MDLILLMKLQTPKMFLAMIDGEVPDVIITDACMPYMDGIEFSRITLGKYPDIKSYCFNRS